MNDGRFNGFLILSMLVYLGVMGVMEFGWLKGLAIPMAVYCLMPYRYTK